MFYHCLSHSVTGCASLAIHQHMFLDKIALSFPDYQKCFHSNDSSRVVFHSKSLRGTLTPHSKTKQTVIKNPHHRDHNKHTYSIHIPQTLSLSSYGEMNASADLYNGNSTT